MSKTNFDNKLPGFNRKITSNKTRYLEVQKNLKSLILNYYNFLLGTIQLTSNDRSQNMSVYQPALEMLELIKDKGIYYVPSCKPNGV